MDWLIGKKTSLLTNNNNKLRFFALFSVVVLLSLVKHCDGSESHVKFLKAPREFSHRSSAIFVFDGNLSSCSGCTFTCKLDNGIAFKCESKKVSYSNLQDGKHIFEVCTNGLGCVTYNWTIDTVPPTAYITASSSFTNALNFSVNVSFSEPCFNNGGFTCLSTNSCNLLVYGAGKVIPSSLVVLQRNLKYSLAVNLSSQSLFGRVVLVMDKNFCADRAGNSFTRTPNSTFFVHYDRRSVFVNLRLHIPERLLELNGKTRTVLATNNNSHLKAYLYFSEPILNSSAQILNTLQTSSGSLIPIIGESIGNRRFGFLIENVPSVSVVTLSLASSLIISRPGTPVSPVSPTTFLYDSKRPSVKLSTTSRTRTRDHNIPIAITFMKPVFGFNSSHVTVTGGDVQSFNKMSRSTYIIGIKASDKAISVQIPENVTADVSGNKNLKSNVLQVRHYSVPLVSSITSALVTSLFLATCLVAGFLSFSTSSLQTVWTFKGPSSLRTDPSRNLFRIAYHIQVFAFSKWLAVMLPIEYYEFTTGLQWSIPYFHLPWETGHVSNVMVGSSPYTAKNSFIFNRVSPNTTAQVFGLPLDPMEYRFYFENPNTKPEAEALLDPKSTNGWTNFDRSMFWLALIGGSLVLLHIILLFFLKLRKKSAEHGEGFGALTFPRFEIFLVILALPCVSEVSAALVKGKETSGVIVGILLLSLLALLLLSLFLFLSYGITFAKLLQYKEVHRERSTSQWYQDLIRVTLGPGKRGQWTWKNKNNNNNTNNGSSPSSSSHLIALGPLFEDIRGPPKYMLSQIAGSEPSSTKRREIGDQIIASDDETEDAEAPIIQKLFGIMRVYYTLLECAKRVTIGVLAGLHKEDWSSNSSKTTPSLALLCLTSFQLFFLVLKKPFIKKRVQLVEIISVSSEVGLFAAFLALKAESESSSYNSRLGILMVSLFLIGYVPQLVNEWLGLYEQIKLLDPEEKSSLKGLKIALFGSVLVFLPRRVVSKLERKYSKQRSQSQSTKSSSHGSGTEKPWLRQLREMAKASFSREGNTNNNNNNNNNEASTSRSGGWSGLWGSKKNNESPSSGDSKPNSSSINNNKTSKGLYKDLEEIFASK